MQYGHLLARKNLRSRQGNYCEKNDFSANRDYLSVFIYFHIRTWRFRIRDGTKQIFASMSRDR